jgi:FtsP/CotA-like multicopper oxidase with cupredoxin domain
MAASTRQTHSMGRRSFLAMTAVGLGGGLLGACSPFRPGAASGTPAPTAVPAGAGGTLTVPPLLVGQHEGGRRVYDLIAQAGRTAIVPGGTADTWGFNGPMLGPTIRMTRGEQVRVRVRNELPEPTTVHWHGMHLPAASDGGPHQPIEPGEVWEPTWTVAQQAATLWYHPHPHGATEAHVYRGLAGMLLVDDAVEGALDLPRTYGVDDIPLILQDKQFDGSGQLIETDRRGPGMLGTTMLVNGTLGPTLEVAAESTRFRILNAATARSMNLGFSDDRSFELIASDGGLLTSPVVLTRVLLTPGERVEIIVRTAPGDAAVLRSFPQNLGNVAGTTGADDQFDVLTLSAPAPLASSAPTPAALAVVDRHDRAAAQRTRRFELGADRINAAPMDMTRIDEVITVDQLEVWEVLNTARTPHNFHVHGVQFQIVDIDGQAPRAELAGWKDTVYLPPTVLVRLAMRFTEHTDATVPYMYHCHLLWHEDIGMMGQFVVVPPGVQPTGIANGHDH